MSIQKFRSHGDGASLVLDENERGTLIHLFSELAFFLQPDEPAVVPEDPLAAMVGIGQPADEPDDPALARLLPEAYPDDPEAAAEFRRLTQDGLRARKTAAVVIVLESLHTESKRLILDERECLSWLTALADLRLVLGSRLGVTDDPASHEWDEDDAAENPRAAMLAVFEWVGFLQDTMVRVLTKRL